MKHITPERLRLLVIRTMIVAIVSPLLSLAVALGFMLRFQENSRMEACDFYGGQLRVYAENPPTTTAGRGTLANYRDKYNEKHCTSLKGVER